MHKKSIKVTYPIKNFGIKLLILQKVNRLQVSESALRIFWNGLISKYPYRNNLTQQSHRGLSSKRNQPLNIAKNLQNQLLYIRPNPSNYMVWKTLIELDYQKYDLFKLLIICILPLHTSPINSIPSFHLHPTP